MRIFYGFLLLATTIAALIGVQKWRGPVVPALTVTMMPLELRIVASGEVRYQTLARIGAEITGTVIARHVREGDQVQQGALLIELNPKEARARLAQAHTLLQQLQQVSRPQAQAALTEAQNNLRQASREVSRRDTLATQGMIPIEQVEQAQRLELNAQTALTRAKLAAAALAAGSSEEQLLQQRIASADAELAKTRIYAPFTGRIQTRNVEPGDLVQPSKILLEIARNDTNNPAATGNAGLEVVVALDEKNFAPVQLGQQVQLIADAWPEQTLAGLVSFIAPAVDSDRGTIDVHIRVLEDSAQPPHTLLQGMTVSATIIADQRDNTVVLPNDYLRFDTQPQAHASTQAQVLRWNHGTVQAVPVQLGLRNLTHSEILSGVSAGEIVVQTNNIKDGQHARIRLEAVAHVIR